MPVAIAVLSSLCFGIALVTARVGLRSLDSRSGAAISIPTATVIFIVIAPLAVEVDGFDVLAAAVFAGVGLFFPAVVTLLTFRSNQLLGPTITAAVSGTAPLFALLAAALFLGERVPSQAMVSAVGVVLGIALMSWRRPVMRGGYLGWSLLWPVAGAALRGFAQVAAKAGLLIWANPFAASLIGYLVSSATVIGADRLNRSQRPRLTRECFVWFCATGVLNGTAVLLMYVALTSAPVWTVAPIVATYPLVAGVVGAAVLHDEKLPLRAALGVILTVGAVAYLVASGP